MYHEITDPEILNQLRPGGNLREADLRNADIAAVIDDLENINFEGAHLEGANLENVNLAGAYLTGAHLEGANLAGAYLTQAHLEGADFSGANLDNSFFDNISNFNGTRFIDANCFSINLDASTLRGADFRGADFIETDLQGVDFRGAHLEEAHFIDANLEGADFRGAFLDNAFFEGATIDVNTRFTRANLSQTQIQLLGLLQEIPPPVAGVAFEIHNLFSALNIDAITDYLNNFNNDNNHPVNPNAIPDNNEPNNLFTPLIAFINKSELFLPGEKEIITNNLQTIILQRVQLYGNIGALYPLLRSVINFVSRQENNFVEQYIRVYIQDCLEAYSGNNGASCTKGMVERIITVLNEVSKQMLTEFPENPTYNDIKRLFPNIVFNEVVQEWAQKYLQDGENEEELASLTIGQRKRHFINFMRVKYGGLLTESILQQINNEATRYENEGIFERMSFGGRKNKKTRKRKSMKRKSIKKKKSMKKKSIKKRKSNKKR